MIKNRFFYDTTIAIIGGVTVYLIINLYLIDLFESPIQTPQVPTDGNTGNQVVIINNNNGINMSNNNQSNTYSYHQNSSNCKLAESKYHKYKIKMPEGHSIRLRSKKLSEKEIKETNLQINEHEEDMISALSSGTIVELLSTEGKWHKIRVCINNTDFIGFIVTRFRNKPILTPLN